MLKKNSVLLILLMLISVGNSVGSENAPAAVPSDNNPSMMQNTYNAVAAHLHKVKKSASKLLFSHSPQAKNVPKGMTIDQALSLVQQLSNEKLRDSADRALYWQTNSLLLLKCTKLLLETVEKQILKTLQEIDRRLLYWLYQKDHQWQYFFSKNPVKWVMGKKQDEEVETNIAQLQSKQDELFIRLGELSTIDWHQYLVAMNDYQAAYEWVGKALSIAAGMHDNGVTAENSDYGAIVNKLSRALNDVSALEATILSSMADTALPHYIMRNWVKYGALMMAGYWAYQSPELASYVTPEAIVGYQKSLEKYWTEDIVPPVTNIVNKIFFRGVTSAERESLENSLGVLLARIAPKEKETIMLAEKAGNLVPLQEFFNNMQKPVWRIFIKDDIAQVALLLGQLKVYHLADTFSVVRNVGLLTPAAFVGWAGYHGYKQLTKYDYTPIRLALLAISSLFVEKLKPLDDLEYGKMIFLLYNLKEKASRELPVKNNVRSDFIDDLEKIESRDFDSAAKRRIIKDMFKKYNFLGLVQ